MQEKELRRCPFCGGDAELCEEDGKFAVRCGHEKCILGTVTRWFGTRTEAVITWNTRVPQMQAVKEIEEYADCYRYEYEDFSPSEVRGIFDKIKKKLEKR